MALNLSQKWEKEQLEKRLKELKAAGIELILENIHKIIEVMSFRIRSKQQPNDCPYYREKTTCHPEVEDLNCFLCACPKYESSKLEGGCKRYSKKGKFTFHKNLPKGKVWDCSDCTNYHSPKAVEKYLTKNIEHLRELSKEL